MTQEEYHKICGEYGLKMVYHKNEKLTEKELRKLCELIKAKLELNEKFGGIQ